MAQEKAATAAVAETPAPQVSQGVVKWFDPRKGYGFISCPAASGNGEVDVFVHQTSIKTEGRFRTLYEDEEVTFEAVPGKKEGTWEAKNVHILEASPERERRDKRAAKKAAKAAEDKE